MGLERSLWELDLSNNYLTVVPSKAIRYLQKLKHLDLRGLNISTRNHICNLQNMPLLLGNDISSVFPENWRGLENSLEKLILADNSLRHLPMDSFSGLPHLDTLDLSGNSLKEIDPNVFRDGMGKLSHLIFADNQLTVIPYLALAPLNTLRTLDLSNNLITAMKQPIEAGSANVHIELGMSLDELKLNHNQIAILNTGDFEHFDILNATYLDGNPIVSVEVSYKY